ncbi:Single-stranded-DNA-specific exonuclease RecJ [Caenispirillum salinarum AK4]|uniref:Single-stranded-DNA-specific exonuclease RecJ n=1 Tax=Caenispirillum salinarum AK4 TaxID=1238182 RepID=K9GMT1_9PROT|nr:single-stranded-DNA-specific exonuclease RecJ [Caenispirillum salinarum]EKV27305.1 Single-stranded-DNA-specific exonuclease RecJ [Caenispirillum salinarum AK4]
MTASPFLGVETSLNGRRWMLRPGDERAALAISQRLELPEVVGRVLAARGVDLEAAQGFLNPTLRDLIPNPSVFAGMDDAAERLAVAIEGGERIAIFGDYDVDGATSSSLLVRYLRSLGADVRFYIPDRMKEGYGPNAQALLKLQQDGVSLAVTVDCGITAFEPLEQAEAAGLDVIVVDHHQAEPRLPAAVAVVNPKRLDCESGQGHLAAVGVAFMLCVATNRALRDGGFFLAGDRREPDLRQWLDIVALGTVCDVVPLTGLNRALVTQGLKVCAQRRNPGIAALAQVAGVKDRIDAYHLGFILGPRVNAGGRVGESDLGTRLLTTDSADEATALAMRLHEHNGLRQEIEAAVLAEAIEQVETTPTDAPMVFAHGQGWHPGVVGIVASRLKERYAMPACVLGVEGGVAKGSGRSVPGLDLGRVVIAAREAGILMAGGGHAMAAGFTVAEEKLPGFRDFVAERLRAQMDSGGITPTLELDGALDVSGASSDLVEMLARCGPYGAGNEEPRFVISHCRIAKADVVGSGHVRMFLSSSNGMGRLKAIAFRCVDGELGQTLLNGSGRVFHIAGTLRADTWQGRTEAQLVVDDASVA